MILFEDIRDVHLEISSLCNAACPWCPRNFWGYPYNGGYPEVNLSLSQCERIFNPSFLNQLTSIRINGNFGDIVMNLEGADIVEYFYNHNKNIKILISTNGSARTTKFWQRLAQAKAQIAFCIDGLEDTHHLYRQNTIWQKVINNAKIFINAGGHAIWKMIKFKHNVHQVNDCKLMSQSLGFRDFSLVTQGRDTAPVFDSNGNLTHVLGDYQGETEFKVLFHRKQTDDVILQDIIDNRIPKKIVTCETKKLKSIYIAANGDVSPCCYTGFYPKTYGHGQYHQASNSQLIPIIAKNNAIEHPLEQCVEWFSEVENRWKIDSYQQGRLIICDDNCGS